jgi:osmotically inducible protein OsmC
MRHGKRGSTYDGAMPRIVREADVVWEGTIARGAGTISAASSGSFSVPYSNASRIADPEGKTSPEELLAAAHAGCFAMSLGSELARAGTPPERLDVRCTITMDEVEGRGHQIVHSAISARAVAPGADREGFERLVVEADEGCPLSALIRASAEVSVDARLEEE